jgi:hypothetical protein
MQRLAPWQRNMIALARGITLKASGRMKWIANVDVLAATTQEAANYSMFPIEADFEMEAAQSAALSVAKELYGETAQVGFVTPKDAGFYHATCGLYQGHGLTKGRSLSIEIMEYRGAQ